MKRMQIRHSIVKDKAGYRRTCAAPNFGGKKCNDDELEHLTQEMMDKCYALGGMQCPSA